MNPTLIAVAAGAGVLYGALERFRRTSHGDNPWSVDGFIGATLIMGHVETVANLTGATWSSVFRSPQVQRALYNAKRKDPAQWAVVEAGARKRGMSTEAYVEFLSTNTRHARALAADFTHAKLTTAQLAVQIFEHAKAGRIGRVKKVLDERDHVHVEWLAPWEAARSPVLETL